jgi:hypothetical protein
VINAIAASASPREPHQGKPGHHGGGFGRAATRWFRPEEPDSRALLPARNNQENPSSATIPHYRVPQDDQVTVS